MASMVRRAEAAGYNAVVVTVDTPILGWRERDLKYAYLPFLQGHGIANYLADPAFRSGLRHPPEENPEAAVAHFLETFVNPAFSWDGIDDLRSHTSLPLVLKGITHPEDARLALEHGVDGIVVSNHGGRQVDGAVAALDALPAIKKVVGDQAALLMDSGVRRGSDVLKALALGASAVLIGRPYVYALAVDGEDGVGQLIRNLLADVDLEMALCGCRAIKRLEHGVVMRVER
jgi:isopentenyl diphosphate isomerase/L-lactate dehydrogenase-like FMN-dependent dehydrogenase